MALSYETINDRKQIRVFIRASPAVIVLMRRPKIETSAGGHTWGEPDALPPQTFRLVPFKRRLTHGTTSRGGAGEGRVAALPYVLLGEHDADVLPNDYFDYNGLRYEVLSLEPNRSVRTAAELIEKGATGG